MLNFSDVFKELHVISNHRQSYGSEIVFTDRIVPFNMYFVTYSMTLSNQSTQWFTYDICSNQVAPPVFNLLPAKQEQKQSFSSVIFPLDVMLHEICALYSFDCRNIIVF